MTVPLLRNPRTSKLLFVGFEHPNIELKPRCQPSVISVECGKRLRLCTDYRTIIIAFCFIVMTKKEGIEFNVFGAKKFPRRSKL